MGNVALRNPPVATAALDLVRGQACFLDQSSRSRRKLSPEALLSSAMTAAATGADSGLPGFRLPCLGLGRRLGRGRSARLFLYDGQQFAARHGRAGRLVE
jgi:hypothetical protein